MTRARVLPAILNVRLDDALAAEVARIARSSRRAKRMRIRSPALWPVDVWRQLEADDLARPFRETLEAPGDGPGARPDSTYTADR